MAKQPPRPMKWEEEKSKVQYNIELKTFQNLVGKLLELNKILESINAGRNQFHKG